MLEFAPGEVTVSGFGSACHVRQAGQAGQGEGSLMVEILGAGAHRDIPWARPLRRSTDRSNTARWRCSCSPFSLLPLPTVAQARKRGDGRCEAKDPRKVQEGRMTTAMERSMAVVDCEDQTL
jgi:hypothetical protein